MMWKKIGLIGRDHLLKKSVLPRIRSNCGFILSGQHGIGKTAILEWSYENAKGKKAFVSATWTVKEILKEICIGWDLTVKNPDGEEMPKSRWQVQWMLESVLVEKDNWLMIDDMHRMTPAVINKIKPVRDRCNIIGTAIYPIRKDELRRMMWGIPMVKVAPLKKADMMKIAEAGCVELSSKTPIIDAVHASRGVPAHLFHALRGEVVPESAKTREEEIDISPIFLILLAGIMIFRYVSRGMESQGLYLLSGVGMAFGMIFRFFLFRGMRK